MTKVVPLTDLKDEQRRRAESLRDGYMPRETIYVDPSLEFHTEYETDIDPITYEVLRSKFWNLNWDHQETIRRTAGSLVVVQGYDFNSSIQTELGEGVVYGPGNLFFAGEADGVVQWTLEHRSASIGISDGDIFIQDDPWVGTNHAMDTSVYMPVFIDGRLFAWVYNVAHQRELGGVEPGGFVQTATDVFAESTFWPPVKLGENGVVREDLLDAWVRRSRISGLMTIEVKAQVAGVTLAKRRLLDMVRRYGAQVVKGGMQRMISDTADAVRSRLQEIPDGEWRDTRYIAGAHPDDKKLYRICMTMKKSGDRVLITNDGTDRSTGAFNITAPDLRAAVLSPMLQILAFDQQLCGSGVLRQLDFKFVHDAINSASHPAAISTALGMASSITQAINLTGKMMSGSKTARQHIFGASGLATLIYNHTFGIDRHGDAFANFPFDGTNGGIGAFADRDGIDHGGGIASLINPVGSVEVYEQDMPFLYLYRRELPGSGAHGKYRGGDTYVTGWTGHKSDAMYISSGGLLPSVTQGIGLLGGYPASGGTMFHALDTKVLKEFSAGRIPSDPAAVRDLAADIAPPPPKKFDNRLLPGDVFEVMPNPGAGHGDILNRAPDAILADVGKGRITVDDAKRVYGVVISDGVIDRSATEGERAAQITERLTGGRAPRAEVSGQVSAGPRVTENVVIGSLPGHAEPHFGCAHCRRALGLAAQGYRPGCVEVEMAMQDVGYVYSDPRREAGVDLVFRRYMCPDCGTALDGEVCLADDVPGWDVRIA